MNITVSYYDEDDNEIEAELPAKFEVCGRCEGHGTHLNPSIGKHAYSIEEFYETFHDEEDREQYFKRGGIYDVQCEECKGEKVVKVVDEDALKNQPELQAHYEQWVEHGERVARWNREDAATRRMESGGY